MSKSFTNLSSVVVGFWQNHASSCSHTTVCKRISRMIHMNPHDLDKTTHILGDAVSSVLGKVGAVDAHAEHVPRLRHASEVGEHEVP